MKVLILGAGPAGLSLAHALKDSGVSRITVLEAEGEAGGLCRSAEVNGAPLDTGGGHFLDVVRPEVTAFLFRFMPETEWALFERDSRIRIRGQLISHPFEANLWQLDTDSQVEYLMSIARAGCVTGSEAPAAFRDWIRWKLGDRIAEEYMLPYNRKMFGEELDALGTYWLEKLPDVSFEDTLRSCLTGRAHAKQPGHARFYYPKQYGYGELWRRMADALGDALQYGKRVAEIDFDRCAVTTRDGSAYEADLIVTTVPWTSLERFPGMPEDLKASLQKLKHTGIVIAYDATETDDKAHWIYVPDESVPHHRVLLRHNFLRGARGVWTETRMERFAGEADEKSAFLRPYAYPLNTLEKPAVMRRLLDFAKEHRVYGLGRWGEHAHFNSDVVVERAMQLAKQLCLWYDKTEQT
ncbi:MAG: FAD-dependent oxidoreductase [Lachnospiraceae bacterium]|nr:FAD-dependent oxidoreductase [Lachnospiraceae bacterium]